MCAALSSGCHKQSYRSSRPAIHTSNSEVYWSDLCGGSCILSWAGSAHIQEQHLPANKTRDDVACVQKEATGGERDQRTTRNSPLCHAPPVFVAGKGILGWVETSIPQDSPLPPPTPQPTGLWGSVGFGGQGSPSVPRDGGEGLRDVKVVVGNKAMMLDEGVGIGKAVDDYMRDMEVVASPPPFHSLLHVFLW
jgi:hypothetical protein